jgi:hypothetical protein
LSPPENAGNSPEESKLRTPEYLDLARQQLGLPSDYALQKPLGVTKQQLSRWRTGVDSFSNVAALRIAELTSLQAERVLIDAQIEKAKTPEEQAIWRSIMEKISASFNRRLSGSWQGVERRSYVLQ